MSQASLIAYLAVGGAFLDLAYWDVPYYVFVAIAVTRYIIALPNSGSVAERPIAPRIVTTRRLAR